MKWVCCKYCGARLRRDPVGQYCPTKNCDWQHGLPKSEDAGPYNLRRANNKQTKRKHVRT